MLFYTAANHNEAENAEQFFFKASCVVLLYIICIANTDKSSAVAEMAT